MSIGILTAIGEAKVAASFGGQVVTPHLVRIGDGNGAPITPTRLMTDLVRRVGQAYPITLSARDSVNPSMWRIQTEIPGDQGPFFMREMAVFDTAGDMIAISSHPVAEFEGPGGTALSVFTDITFPVTGQANISITLTAAAQVPLARLLRPPFIAVESATVFTPPVSPAPGATYVIAAGAIGAWLGLAGALAQWTGLDWSITPAPAGTVVHAIDTGVYLRRTATAWVPFSATETAAGLITLATLAEAIEGTNATDAITPATLDAALDARLAGIGGAVDISQFRRLPFLAVNSVAINAPPGSPAANDIHVIGAAPSGLWASRPHHLAQWTGANWVFAAAPVDTLVRAQDSDLFWQRTAGGWSIWSPGLTRGQALHLGQ